jgi:hypothetical protein
LNKVLFGLTTFEQLMKDGVAKGSGKMEKFMQLKGMLDEFEQGFEILPGTKKAAAKANKAGKEYSMDDPAMIED